MVTLFYLFTFVVLPLLVGVLSHLWLIQHQKKRLNNLSNQSHPLITLDHQIHSPIFCFEDSRPRLNIQSSSMEEKREEQKPIRRKISLQSLDVEEAQRQSQIRATIGHQTSVTSPPSSPLKKSSSTRSNCLCSPTTHVGSFRCRLHRHGPTKSNMRRGHSVGSNLSDLANKFSSNSTLATSSLQTSASSSQMQ